jgi:hypothetical protein
MALTVDSGCSSAAGLLASTQLQTQFPCSPKSINQRPGRSFSVNHAVSVERSATPTYAATYIKHSVRPVYGGKV